MKHVCVIVAAAATIWAAASWLTGFDADFVGGAVVALISLGVVFYLDYREEQWMGQYRREVWERREAEVES